MNNFWQKIFLMVAAAALAACSATRLGYDNAEPVVRYMASSYLDLSSEQSDDLKPRIAHFHRWHRANELPAYAALLYSASQRAARGVTAEDVAWGISNVRARARKLGAKAAEDAAPVLATLGPAQIAALEHKFADDNEKYAKEMLSTDDKKRRRAQLKRALDRCRDFAGDLTHEQEARVERFMLAHERNIVLRFEDRLRWQHDMVALLRQHHKPEELGRRLAELFARPELRRSEEFLREDKRWEEDFAQLLVDLDHSLSPRQRASVVKRLIDYAEDADALAAKKGEAA